MAYLRVGAPEGVYRSSRGHWHTLRFYDRKLKPFLSVSAGLLLCASACGSPATPVDPNAPKINPASATITVGDLLDLTVDRMATCSASGGTLAQTGNQLKFTPPDNLTAETSFQISCAAGGSTGTASVKVQGPEFVTVTEADGLGIDIGTSTQLPSFFFFQNGSLAAFSSCSGSMVKKVGSFAVCTDIALRGRGAQYTLAAYVPTIDGFPGTARFRGQPLPTAACPDGTQAGPGAPKTCNSVSIAFK